MKLSDVMSSMHLQMYAEVALVIFFGVFLVVLFQVLKGNDEHWQRARFLPLADTKKGSQSHSSNDNSEIPRS